MIHTPKKSPKNSRRRARTRAGLAGCLAVTLLAAAGCGGGDGEAAAPGATKTETLRVSVRSAAATYALVYWAEAKGYFAKEGLDVKISVGATGQAAQLVAGQVDLVGSAEGTLLSIVNSGKQVSSIYGTDVGGNAHVVAANPKITSPAQCTSMTTATTSTNSYGWAVQLQKIFDVKWKLAQLSDVSSFAANVINGRTDCAVGNTSYFQTAIDQGKLRVIFNPNKKADLPADWPQLGLENVWGGLTSNLKDKKPAVEKFLKGYDAAAKVYMTTDPKAIAATIVKNRDWSAIGVAQLAQAVNDYKPNQNPNAGYISKATWDKTIGFFANGGLAFLDDNASKFEYASNVDMSYYDAAIGAPR